MVNTIWKENFLIMCSKLCLNARDSGHFAQLLLICRNYSLQTLCGAPHNVCNEEGKLEGLPLNRALRDEDGDIYDVVAGTFMVVGLTDDSFGSLTVEQMQKFSDLVTMVSARSPQLMARPVPSVRCIQGLPRRSCPLSAMSSWISAPDWKCSIAAAALRALSKLPPTAVAASIQISGRWRLPALAVKAESGAYR